jgi:hypothetical protein
MMFIDILDQIQIILIKIFLSGELFIHLPKFRT